MDYIYCTVVKKFGEIGNVDVLCVVSACKIFCESYYETYIEIISDSASLKNYINSTFSYDTPSVIKPSEISILVNTGNFRTTLYIYKR